MEWFGEEDHLLTLVAWFEHVYRVLGTYQYISGQQNCEADIVRGIGALEDTSVSKIEESRVQDTPAKIARQRPQILEIVEDCYAFVKPSHY